MTTIGCDGNAVLLSDSLWYWARRTVAPLRPGPAGLRAWVIRERPTAGRDLQGQHHAEHGTQACAQAAETITGESKKRVHFALVLKGSTKGVLLAGPHPVPMTKVRAAQDQPETSTTVRGTCFGEANTLAVA
jgi:hypothetical protein